MDKSVSVLILHGDDASDPYVKDIVAQHVGSVRCQRVTDVSQLADTLEHGDWDVVVSDACVPGVSLSEIADAVRKRDASLPLIAVSERAGEERAVECLKQGAWDVVLKDNLSRLMPAIRYSLREAAARRARAVTEDGLRESVELYRLLSDYAEGFVSLHHVDGRRLYLSPAICCVTGWTPEELRSSDWRARVHPDDLELVDHASESNLLGKVTSVEYRALCKDGTWKWVETRCRPLFGPDGKVDKKVVWTRDITERKQAAEKHEHLMTQFLQAQKMEAVGRLAGGVAHDFNNMLQTIMGTVEVLLSDTHPEDARVADLREIETAARRSADLTRQLLAFARRQTITPRVLDLNAAVADTLKMLRRLIGEDIDLLWRPAHNAWTVEMDPSQLDQVLTNLVVNARDAIAGHGRVIIETENVVFDEAYCQAHPEACAGEQVVLAVSDDGCGMDKETLARLFEPFFTTKGDGKGTGLGLATVYGIVQQNHGCIRVTSEPWVGTTFRIYLPRHRASPEEMPATPKPAASPSGKETVLLVEDEESLLRLAHRLLESMGYNVLSTSSPRAALRLAVDYKGRIDLLLTDVVMPEMDGRTLQLRISELRSGLKCLFMSGYPADTIAQCGVLEKGVYLIQKPFTKAALGAKLREVLSSQTA